MSGSRGRKVTGRPGDARWPNQQPYYNQNASIPDSRNGWDNWNFPAPSTGYNVWQQNSNLHQVWPSPHYQGVGYYTEEHHPITGDFDQFQHRFPNSFTPPSHFSERSLAHLNQTPLNELSSSGHSGSRDVSSTCDSSSSKQPNSAKDKQNVQSVRSKVAAGKPTAARSRVPSNPSNQDLSSGAKNLVSVRGAEKQNVPVKSTSFMPPNDDLRNKVKASLEKIAATKDQAPLKTTTFTPAEPPVPSSPQKVRESRIPTTEASPSTRHSIRVTAGSHRRTSQSSSTSNSGASNETPNNPLEGLGFIQNTSSSENFDSVSQANRIRNSSGGSSTQESEPLTTIPKEQLNKYIRSMDNHQRRQLVEQPRSIISQYMLNHLVQENQTARARQLSSIRYRVSSNELELTSRTENTVILSEELVDEFKELLSRNDEETTKTPDSEDEEIQVLEPPPKVPPLCIDLDLDDKQTSPSPSPLLDLKNSTPVKPNQQNSISDKIDSSSDFVEHEFDSQLIAASTSIVAPTLDAVHVPKASAHPPLVSEANMTIQVPCPSPSSHNFFCSTVTTQPSPTQEPSTASTNIVPSITTTVSAGKKSFLEKTTKSQRRKEKREKKAKNQNQSAEKDKVKSKKQKKKDKKKSPAKTGKANAGFAQNVSGKPTKVLDLERPENVASAMDRAGELNRFPDSVHGRSALSFLLTDLQSEEQQGKDRIALIDRTIEELQLERKALTDKVLALKQQQFDLLRSAMTANSFVNDSTSSPLDSVTQPIKTPVSTESADQKDKEPTSEEASPVQPIPPSASTQLLSLMHQLEENGVQVALGDMEVVSSDPVPPANVSGGTKRKRIPSDDSKQQKKKGTPTSSPSQSTADIQLVEKPDQLPTNVAVVQPLESNSPSLTQTLSISQINQISSTISSVIAQSLESSSPKKTPIPDTFTDQSKKTTFSSESSLTVKESLSQSKEIPTAISQSFASSPKVTEPKAAEPKAAEPKAAEPKAAEPKAAEPKAAEPKAAEPKAAEPKAAEPKAAEPKAGEPKTAESKATEAKAAEAKVVLAKVVEPKKSAIVPDIVKVVNASNTAEKSTDVIPVRSGENMHTYSRRDESSSQTITPNPSQIIAQGSGATGRLSAQTIESSQVKDIVATTTHPISTQGTASSSASAKQLSSTSKTAYQTKSSNPVMLRPHLSSVRCVFICGPCAFTASEDGTVHIYDLKTNSLSMRILGHSQPVTWLYGISMDTTNDVLKTIKSTTDYLNHLTLITGSEDAHIRQFALESGSLIHERFCDYALTCAVGHRVLSKLYVGTTKGVIFTYNPRINSLRINKFKANGEIICLKILSVRGKRAIIVAARRMDPVVYDLETEDALFTLVSNIPSSSFYCISNASNNVFCCDANKNVFKFDTNSDNQYQTETLPSAAVSSFYDGKRFLILGCMDGVIRVIDTAQKPPSRIFTLPGQGLKTLTCMKVAANMVVCGSLGGEVACIRLPNLEVMCKVNH